MKPKVNSLAEQREAQISH